MGANKLLRNWREETVQLLFYALAEGILKITKEVHWTRCSTTLYFQM